MKFNSPIAAGILAGLVAIYYGTTNFLMGSISTPAFLMGLIFFIACTALFIRHNRKQFTNLRDTRVILSVSVIAATVVILFLMSFASYITTGKLLGISIGGLAGGLLLARDKDKLASNRIVAGIIIGVVMFVVLRNITFDVLTMGSGTLEPKVHKGQKVLVNNLSFGLCVPFMPYHIMRWGNPNTGDLVLVVGPNARPFLREVLNVNKNQVLLNIDGWLPREKLIGKAMPL
jgi:hypothetical protein